VVKLVVTGGSLTRKTEKVTSLSPGRGTLTNKIASINTYIDVVSITKGWLWLLTDRYSNNNAHDKKSKKCLKNIKF